MKKAKRNSKGVTKEKYMVSLTPDIHDRAAGLAREQGTSLSQIIEQCLRAKLAEVAETKATQNRRAG